MFADPLACRSTAVRQADLVGRDDQISALLAAITDAPRGRKVVVSGDVGMGKSAMLDIACRHAESHGFRVLSIAGAPSESDTPFAGVHQLIHALGHSRIDLEQHQSLIDAALRSAAGEQIDTARVAMALLNLFAAVEKKQPVLITIDDGNLLDEPSRRALIFAARRRAGRSITAVVGIPDRAGKVPIGDGYPVEIELGPLSRDDASALLELQPNTPSGLRREQILAAASGNPAAIIAFCAAAAEDDAVGPATEPLVLPTSSHGIYSRRFSLLPAATRAALLTLAAASDDDLRHLMPGALVDPETLAPAESAGFVRVEFDRVSFRDPLIRSAAYHRAPAMARSTAHQLLADALVGVPHRRVWHRAAAALKPNGALAAKLEKTGGDVLQQDGYGAAAVVLRRAATLSTDRDEYARRLVRAASLARQAGDMSWSVVLSRRALESAGTGLQRIKAQTELGAALSWGSGSQADVLDILLDAATLAAETAPEAAWAPLRVASAITFLTDDSAARWAVAHGLRQVEDALGSGGDGRHLDLYGAATRTWVRTATDLLRAHLDLPDISMLAVQTEGRIELAAVGASAWLAGDPDLAVRCLREAGAAAPRFGGMASIGLAWSCVDSGRWDEAVQAATDMRGCAAATDWPVVGKIADLVMATVAARRGQVGAAREHLRLASDSSDFRDQPALAAWMYHAAGSLALAENRGMTAYAELASLFDESGLPLHVYVSYLALPDYAEAAVLTGRVDEARGTVARILDHLPRPLSPRLTQLVAHAHAVLHPEDADARYAAALADPAGNRWPFERARLRISYAGWLRRHRRRRDSQHQLATALTVMQGLRAAPWIDVCTRELRAAGVRPQASSVQSDALSSQEHNVVYLVSQGYTNPQIAVMLNLSVRTVSNHLYRSFPKLGVTSRHQIRDVVRPPALPAGIPSAALDS